MPDWTQEFPDFLLPRIKYFIDALSGMRASRLGLYHKWQSGQWGHFCLVSKEVALQREEQQRGQIYFSARTAAIIQVSQYSFARHREMKLLVAAVDTQYHITERGTGPQQVIFVRLKTSKLKVKEKAGDQLMWIT